MKVEYAVDLLRGAELEDKSHQSSYEALLELTLAKTRFNIDKDTIQGQLIFKTLPTEFANSNSIEGVYIELVQQEI